MSSLLPSLQAADLREALTSYLATTFALTGSKTTSDDHANGTA